MRKKSSEDGYDDIYDEDEVSAGLGGTDGEPYGGDPEEVWEEALDDGIDDYDAVDMEGTQPHGSGDDIIGEPDGEGPDGHDEEPDGGPKPKRTRNSRKANHADDEADEEDVWDDEEKPKRKHPEKQQAEKKPKKRKKKRAEEYEDDYEDEYEDDDYDDEDDYDDAGGGSGGGKVIIAAALVAALVAVGGVYMYNQLKTSSSETAQEAQATQEDGTPSEAEQETETSSDGDYSGSTDGSYGDEDDGSSGTSITLTATPVPTSTPKPMPSATPSPVPETETEYTTDDSYIMADTTESADEQAQVAEVVMIGDLRFREMANIVSAENCGWVCSSTGDYDWLVDSAFDSAESMVGEGTKVFISIGLNDISRYTEYASAISAKASEWQAKGATVYFVSVGPVAPDSDVPNNDICTFNTYMYQNLGLPFIDAYNYLVGNGFESADSTSLSYSDATTQALYDYICQFI